MIPKRIEVGLKSRSYDIIIGNDILAKFGQYLKAIDHSQIFIISDDNVAKLHLDRFSKSLNEQGFVYKSIILKAGESTKSFGNLQSLCDEILSHNIDRKALLIAFGGGVIGDLCGFVASILLRGISFIQVPTTLLAAVDRSVGGKTAINSKFGKNLIGSFYQPKLVFCDLAFLSSLSQREFLSGYAEIVKYGLIQDINFFEYLLKNQENIKKRNIEILAEIVFRSCQIKADIVSQDEKENDIRALLNFGHSFGHVFETETNYSSELLHGEAVAIGMIMAVRMSIDLGLLEEKYLSQIKNHFEEMGFVVNPNKIRSQWNINNLVSHIHKDKKNTNKGLTFILLTKIGNAIIQKNVSEKLFKEIVLRILNEKK